MTNVDALGRGRAAFLRRAWTDAHAELLAADQVAPLEPEDLERLGTAAYLIGRDLESSDLLARAHHEFLQRGQVERAARCAFWLAFGLFGKGENARGGGWLARAQRLLDDGQHDCVERGYLLFLIAFQKTYTGDLPEAYASFSRAAEVGERFRDPDLIALARHGQGRTLTRTGDITRGTPLLDEAMAAIEAGDVSPIVAGQVYCSVIEACTEIFDLRRAQEWTASLTRWCESQPDLVPYRGQCLVRRAEIMRLHGAWQDAMIEAQRAHDQLSEPPPPQPAVGLAQYQQAELHRLRGEFREAEASYRAASKWGRKPRPGLALLRLVQGQVDAAAALIRSLLDEAAEAGTRSNILTACVEIALAANDAGAAHAAADELTRIATDLGAPFLHAQAAQAQGALLLAEGDGRASLTALRQAWATWQELEAPYEAARVRVLIALACRQQGDDDSAELELDAAQSVFQQLGAAPDLERVDRLSQRKTTKTASGLTARELQVLRLLAKGTTNKTIATELFHSEKTVARHVRNIFLKLGLSTRAAATAYAYQHGLA